MLQQECVGQSGRREAEATAARNGTTQVRTLRKQPSFHAQRRARGFVKVRLDLGHQADQAGDDGIAARLDARRGIRNGLGALHLKLLGRLPGVARVL